MTRGLGDDAVVSTDPNEAHLTEFDEATRSAWMEAAYETSSDDGSGCRHEAYDTVNGPWLEPSARIGDARTELYEVILADPRTVALDRQWSACMADQGYIVESQEHLLDYIEDELPGLDLLEASPPALAEARAREIDIALASFDCRAPLDDDYATVRLDHERGFFADHSVELVALHQEMRRIELDG